MRSNNGGEYTSKEFEAFCKEEGIKRELTTPYNPQQNGVAERNNRTIIEVVNTMINNQHLPIHLWDEAARTSVYVQNRLSHSALGFKTPGEMYTGKKPEVSHLKIFGFPWICTYFEIKENQVGSFWKEGNNCWIL